MYARKVRLGEKTSFTNPSIKNTYAEKPDSCSNRNIIVASVEFVLVASIDSSIRFDVPTELPSEKIMDFCLIHSFVHALY